MAIPDEAAQSRGADHKWPGKVLRALRVLGAVVLLLLCVEVHHGGALLGLLNQGALLLVPLALAIRGWSAWRRGLELRIWKTPLAGEVRPYLRQALLRSAFWIMFGVALTLGVPAALFAPDEYGVLLALEWGAVVVLALLEWLPLKRLYRTPNVLFALGGMFLAFEIVQVLRPFSAGDAVLLDPPFRGEWNVFNGGRSALLNHHYLVPGQQHALDLDRALAGPPTKDANRLESYAAWGQPLLAPADGTVVGVVYDRPDNPMGKTDEEHLAGNQVTLDIGGGRYVMLGHLQRGSIPVVVGQRVRVGQLLGRCGNSGNTSEPHLHLQVQDQPGFNAPKLRTFPILFRNVVLRRGGRSEQVAAADVRRNDRIVVEGRAR